MYVFLAKKIAIPNNPQLQCVGWNPEHGWLACGGDGGLAKVIKLETVVDKSTGGVRGIAAPTNLAMNQTLEGHQASVCLVAWNVPYRRLTTADASGIVIVWSLHHGVWYDELINNRGTSTVTDVKWRVDGREICIAYADGHVIVGTVEGNRLWSRDMGFPLSQVEWSPDGRNLVFATPDGGVTVANNQGVVAGSINLVAVSDLAGTPTPLACVTWYDGAEGHAYPDSPSFAIAFQNGRVQIMRDVEDASPVLVDSGLRLSKCAWNSSGTVLALAGVRPAAVPGGKEVSEVQFYTPFGKYLTALKVPGGNVTSITWEGGGLRAALAVDSFVFFASVRPEYRWACFGDCLVYAFTRPGRVEQCVVFWNMRTNEKYVKYVKRLISIHAAEDNCVLITGVEPEDNGVDPLTLPATSGPYGIPASNQYIVILCNAIGSAVDSKYIDVRPDFVAVTPFHIIVASTTSLYSWQYRTAVSKLTSLDSGAAATLGLRRKEGRERVYSLEDLGGGPALGDAAASAAGASATLQPICAIAASSKCLLVGKEDGSVLHIALPVVSLEHAYTLRCRPHLLQLNCDSTRFSVIDVNNTLTLFDMEARNIGAGGSTVFGEHLPFERKDMWQMIWAEDYPDLWAAMEKTRMYIFRGEEPEEPTQSSNYLCRFRDLTITTVALDDVMAQPDKPDNASMIVDHETRSLRDTRVLLSRNSIRDCMQFVEENDHPRLWRLLAETALEKLDLISAEKAFISSSDYAGIQFVKRLRLLHDRNKQRAEVLLRLRRFDDAEKLYREIDRNDLAVEMRMRVGDWSRVLELLRAGGSGDDALLMLALQKMGDYYADRQQWAVAIPYYEEAKRHESLVECYYVVEDYDKLVSLIDVLPDGSPVLHNIGYKLQSVGLTESASKAMLHAGDIKGAIDACVQLNQWDKAIELAEAHNLPQIEGLLSKYASRLLDEGNTIAAVELYRKAHRDAECAKLLGKLAMEAAATRVNPLRAKQLYVLAALEVERHRKYAVDLTSMSSAGGGGGGGGGAAATRAGGATLAGGGATVGRAGATIAMATAATLNTLLRAEAEPGVGVSGAAAKMLDKAWHGAEAYHFYMLAQTQLYAGNVEGAMITSQRLSLYENMVDLRDIYSIVALTSYYLGCYGTCSKAFMKLEALESLTAAEREAYSELALSVFTSVRPVDPPPSEDDTVRCPGRSCDASLRVWSTHCMECGLQFPACTASGRPIFDKSAPLFQCTVCRHSALKSEMGERVSCPLCHAPVNPGALSARSPASRARSALTSGGSSPSSSSTPPKSARGEVGGATPSLTPTPKP